MEHHITLPLSAEQLKNIHAGDTVYLTGTIYTARDAAHRRLADLLERGDALPIEMEGAAVYYAGPCPAPEGYPIGSVGPTTSSRMDKWAPDFIRRGMRVMIGKGPRSPEVVQAIRDYGGLYLSAAGGAGALYACCVKSARVVAFEDLGAEAIRELQVEEMPLIAAIDCAGGNLYETGPGDNAFAIRPARTEEVQKVMDLYRQTIVWMRSAGLRQWGDDYPNQEDLLEDIESGDAYVAVLGGRIIGVMTVNGRVEEQYGAISWQIPGPMQSIHRLCIHPDVQGRGCAARMVRFAEELAARRGAEVMRLDTSSDNLRALELYRQAGYAARGTCVFSPRPELTFVCMEKKL